MHFSRDRFLKSQYRYRSFDFNICSVGGIRLAPVPLHLTYNKVEIVHSQTGKAEFLIKDAKVSHRG